MQHEFHCSVKQIKCETVGDSNYMMLHQLNEQLYTATKINSYKTLGIPLKNAFDKEKSKKVVLISPMIASYRAKSMYVAETGMQYGK